MEQKTLSAEPRRSFSNEFKLQMVKLALQPGASVARIAREHDINDNLLFKWLRLWQNEGRISRRLPVTTSSDTGVELLPVEITPDEQKEPVAAIAPSLPDVTRIFPCHLYQWPGLRSVSGRSACSTPGKRGGQGHRRGLRSGGRF
ncbi:putative transposase [Escherichia coli]|nr:putative transposase [Escherichia coli]